MAVHRLTDDNEGRSQATDQQAKVKLRGVAAPEIMSAVGEELIATVSNLLKGLHASHAGSQNEQRTIPLLGCRRVQLWLRHWFIDGEHAARLGEGA